MEAHGIYFPDVIVKITAPDGTVFDNFRHSGGAFFANQLSEIEAMESMPDGTYVIEYRDEETDEVTTETIENAYAINSYVEGDPYFMFMIIERSETDRAQTKLRSDVDYLAMMLDIDLDEE